MDLQVNGLMGLIGCWVHSVAVWFSGCKWNWFLVSGLMFLDGCGGCGGFGRGRIVGPAWSFVCLCLSLSVCLCLFVRLSVCASHWPRVTF